MSAKQLFFPRVQESSTSTGTGQFTLDGAEFSNLLTFADKFSEGDYVSYIISNDTTASEWEQGVGTFSASASAIARTYVLNGSNGVSAVDFSVGTKSVLSTPPPPNVEAQAYSASILYFDGDFVTYGGGNWISTELSTNSTPATSNPAWISLAGGGGGGSGTVTDVTLSVNSGITGAITNPTTTPAISLGLSAITPWSVTATGAISTTGNVSAANIYGTGTLIVTGNITGAGTLGISGTATFGGSASVADTLTTSALVASAIQLTTGAVSGYIATSDAYGNISWQAGGGGGSGTVTTVSATASDGINVSVANPTTTPVLTFSLGPTVTVPSATASVNAQVIIQSTGATSYPELILQTASSPTTGNPEIILFGSVATPKTMGLEWYDGSNTYAIFESKYSGGTPTLSSFNNTLDDGSGNATFVGTVTVNSGPVLSAASGNSLGIQATNGYVYVGPENTSFCHFYTDRAGYYFNKIVEANGGFQVYSDPKLKENRNLIDFNLLDFNRINIYSFDWKKEAKRDPLYPIHDIGVISTEVNGVLPEVVSIRDGLPQTVDYAKLATIWAAKNQYEINQLKARIAKLEARLKWL